VSFSDFKVGPARHLFAALGADWATMFDAAQSFEGLRYAIVRHNDSDVGRFVRAVHCYAKICSSGEYRLLLAICALVDFGHVADELSAGLAWQKIVRGCDGRYRAAIAACVEHPP
jgi:hypothetical protein